MQRRGSIEVLLLLTALSVMAYGCGSNETQEDQLEPPVLGEADAARAVELFQDQGCPVCHGDLAEGVEETGPALRDLAPFWDTERLGAYLRDPEGFRAANPAFEARRDIEFELEMPAYGELTEEELALLGRWLMTR